MEFRRRFYELLLRDHLATHRQMAFVSGPRQVGKTTTCRSLADHYLYWDSQKDRELILAGRRLSPVTSGWTVCVHPLPKVRVARL